MKALFFSQLGGGAKKSGGSSSFSYMSLEEDEKITGARGVLGTAEKSNFTSSPSRRREAENSLPALEINPLMTSVLPFSSKDTAAVIGIGLEQRERGMDGHSNRFPSPVLHKGRLAPAYGLCPRIPVPEHPLRRGCTEVQR